MFGDHVGYIPLQTFNENAADEVRAAVDQLVKQGAQGLVLDMRDNGGGIVEQALETSSLFLREGQEIASVRSRNQPTEVLRSAGRHLALDDSARRAGRRRLGVGHRDRRRRAAGSRPRARHRLDVVRQGTRAVGVSARRAATSSRSRPASGIRRAAARFIASGSCWPNGSFVEVHPDSLKDDDASSDVQVRRWSRRLSAAAAFAPTSSWPTTRCRRRARLPARRGAAGAGDQHRAAGLRARAEGHRCRKGFTVPPAWTPELMRRLDAAKVKIDPKFDATARAIS